MLPFMREQEAEDSSGPGPKPAAEDSADAPQQGQEQEYLSVATKSKSVRRTTCLLAVLFGAGLLCLLLMIKKSAPRKAGAGVVSSAETQLEEAIGRLTGIKSEVFGGMDEIVDKFYEFSDVRQVKVNELAKNPFEHDEFLDSLNNTPDGTDENLDPDAEAMRRQELMRHARHLQLLGIMRSEQGNCCMIDDKVLYEGDLIGGFRVCQIGNNFVRLELGRDGPYQTQSDNVDIILKLAE
ncbi:MAG: hypothetical protein ACYS76_05025 [Planctomycetota bacterium]|jgi:hypothetical protein